MKYIAYIIATTFFRFLALLPGTILYLFSDLLYFILYILAGYRKNVTTTNLQHAFPEWDKRKIRKVRRKFYRHLSDVILENVVIQFYQKRRLEKMFSFSNPEMVKSYYDKGRHVILVTGHYNNWEWATPLSLTFRHLVIGVYRPLKNPYFDKAIRRARTRFGAAAVPMGRIGRALFEYDRQGVLTLTGMVGDQRPIRKHIQYWTNFMNQQTAVFTGSEKLARKFNAVVVFMKVRRIRRGQYIAEIELITDEPGKTALFEITEKHTRILEKLIMEEPANWLWSHNRWKISYEEWQEMEKE